MHDTVLLRLAQWLVAAGMDRLQGAFQWYEACRRQDSTIVRGSVTWRLGRRPRRRPALLLPLLGLLLLLCLPLCGRLGLGAHLVCQLCHQLPAGDASAGKYRRVLFFAAAAAAA